MSNKKLALVFPGGGVRGIMQHVLLSAIDVKLASLIENYKGLGYYIDYVGGTSIGSINAISSIIKNDTDDLKFTQEDNIQMFLDKAGSVLVKKSFINGINTPFYSSDTIQKITFEKCGEIKFNDEKLQAKVLITSFCLEESQPTIWTNIGSEEDRRKTPYHVWDIDNIKLKDAIRASASVPVYLQGHEISYQRDSSGARNLHEIDGGFSCNSPILELISDINFLDKTPISDLFVLSINNGTFSHNLSHLKNAGTYQYMRNARDVLMVHTKSSQATHENIATKIIEGFGGKLRIIDIPMDIDAYKGALKDSYSNINTYKNIAEDFVKQNDEYIQGIAQEISDWINYNNLSPISDY